MMREVETKHSTGSWWWWLLLVSGIVSLILGGALIFATQGTLTLIATLIGIWILLMGLIRFLMAIFDSDLDDRWILAIVGIVGVVLGVVVIRNQEAAIATVVVLVGIYWLIAGLVEVFRSMSGRDTSNRGWRIAAGMLSIVAGAVVLLWPAASVQVLAFIAGIYLIVAGIVEVVGSLRLRRVT
jgi:uncharacterized membrane protein HdeD (DUF308 family)